VRILVLGGSEFIGHTIVERLRAGHDVTVLNRGRRRIDGVGALIADRNDPDAVRAALRSHTFDAVVDVSAVDPTWVGTVREVLSPDRYVYISSAAVYDSYTPPPDEDAPASGNASWGQYGRDNVACERLLDAGRSVIFRPPYVYGPRNNVPREHALWTAMASGSEIRVPAAGHARVQFCSVAWLASAVAAACTGDIPPGVYNSAGADAYDFVSYVELLAAVGGYSPRIVPVPDASVPTRSYFPFRDEDLRVDTAKLSRVFAVPAPTLREGLAATFAAWQRP
jgi:nucleoside-diphosphate-sugar epimerase